MSAALDTATYSGMSELQALLTSYGHNVEVFPGVEYIMPSSWHSLRLYRAASGEARRSGWFAVLHRRKIVSQLGLQNTTAKFVVNYLHGIGSVLFYEKDPVYQYDSSPQIFIPLDRIYYPPG